MTDCLTILTTAWCATCRTDELFEHPDCGDDHGPECPEWACVACGEAIMIGFELADPRAAAGRELTTYAV